MVRLLSVLALVLIGACLFLWFYGVPDPILREVVKRVNHAGIPVDVESITLTLRGWSASNVRYYSRHPDDLEPLFHAQEVLFSRIIKSGTAQSSAWNLGVETRGVRLHPSVEWGLEIPKESGFRTVNTANLSLDFFPDRIELTNGALFWMGAKFHISGTVLKREKDRNKRVLSSEDQSGTPKKKDTVLPIYVSANQFQLMEDRLKTIQLNGGLDITMDFLIDADNYSSSRIDFDLDARDVSFRDVGFSKAKLAGYYTYPKLEINNAVLSRENKSVRLEGGYNLESGEIEGEFKNEITSDRLLLLLPQTVLGFLEKAQFEFKQLPQLSLSFGPAKLDELLNAISGSFFIRGVSYCQLEIESLRGNITREKNRLDLTKLVGTVVGQENRSETVGSSLVGGSATGAVFWDATAQEFGVSASGSMDPSLFLKPLATLRIATNVISRFRFPHQPPQISLELGGNYTDSSTFFINIQGTGKRVGIHDAFVSSMNVSGFYKKGVLRLDPMVAMQGTDFLKGTASLNFKKRIADFDLFGSLSPQLIEDAICPNFNVFGNTLKTPGDTHIKMYGILDWKSMRETDFTAEVKAQRLEIPIAGLDAFSARITGTGPLIAVKETSFSYHDGQGNGEFTIQLDPLTKGMPYEMDIKIKNADFRKLLKAMNPSIDDGISGLLSGAVTINADMKRNFFKTANGHGNISVDKGQLTDLPLFSGFSRLIRKVIPGFNVFSITSLRGTFQLRNGVIHSQDAYFEGDVVSAKGQGSYSNTKGFNALVQAQVLSDNVISKVIRAITDPILKLFELKLEGRLPNPSWKLKKFHVKTNDSASEEESDSN